MHRRHGRAGAEERSHTVQRIWSPSRRRGIRCNVQRSKAAGRGRIDGGGVREEDFDGLVRAVLRGKVQRPPAGVVLGVHRRAAAREEQLRHRVLAVRGGEVQRRVPGYCARVHVAPAREEQLRLLQEAVLRRHVQRAVA